METAGRGEQVLATDPMSPVSVLIPSFNRRETILDAVSSALCQTIAPREVIVVDDGSTDDTEEVLRDLTSARLVTLVSLPQNRGQAAALNVGLRASHGSVVAVLDSDDMWLPDNLERQLPVLEGDPDLTLVYGNQLWWEPWNGSRTLRLRPEQVRSGNLYRALAMRQMTVPLGASLIRRQRLEAIGGWDERLRRHEDRDLTIRLARTGPFTGSAAPVALVRRHREDVNPKDDRDTFPYGRWIEWERMVVDRILAEDAGVLSPRRLRARYEYVWARGWIERGDGPAALRGLSRSVALWPFDPRPYAVLPKAVGALRVRQVQGG